MSGMSSWSRSAPRWLLGFIFGIATGVMATLAVHSNPSAPELTLSPDTRPPVVSADRSERHTAIDTQAARGVSQCQEEFLNRIHAQIDTAVARAMQGHVTPSASSATPLGRTSINDVSAEQQKTYERLRAQLRDPNVNRGLTWEKLMALEGIESLPKPLRDQLLGEAAEMLSRGELPRDTFLSGARR